MNSPVYETSLVPGSHVDVVQARCASTFRARNHTQVTQTRVSRSTAASQRWTQLFINMEPRERQRDIDEFWRKHRGVLVLVRMSAATHQP